MHQIASEAEERLAALGRDIRRCTTVVQPMDAAMVRLLDEIDRADQRTDCRSPMPPVR